MAYDVNNFRQGRQLKFAREYRGLSQVELSKEIKGLSQSNLSRFEKGLIGISEDVKIKIMEFLDFPFDFLNIRIHDVQFTSSPKWLK